MTENVILSDLGVVAAAATAAAIICDKFKIPVILGYLVVGLVLGPFVFEHNWIHDRAIVQSLSELGVIFLLFTLGMEFDLKKLQSLISTSLLALVLQTILMLFIGVQIAPLLGYGPVLGIFLGSLLSISSSMVTIRVLQDRGALRESHAQLAIGILILEDILAILLLVVLSGISASGALPWDSALWSVFVLSVFVVAVFYLGRIFMPNVIQIVHRIGSIELVTLFAVGSLLGIGVLAEQAHLSIGLGAFIAGSLFTNSKLSHKIEESITPLKELFSSVFFVSTGMLINPQVMMEEWPIILLIAACVVVGKIASCSLGLFLAGQRTQTAFQAAVAKSQIGEFSFVIAKLAQSMGLADEKLVSVAVGVSFVTILNTPLASNQSVAIFKAVARISPKPVKEFANVYYRFFSTCQSLLGKSFVFKAVKRPFWQTLTSFFLINGVIITASLASKWVLQTDPIPALNPYAIPVIWVGAALLVSPFVLSILRNLGAVSLLVTDMIYSNTAQQRRHSSFVRTIISHGFALVLIFFVVGAFLSAIASFLPSGYSLVFFFVFIIALALVFNRDLIKINSELEHRFSKSFAVDNESLEQKKRVEVLEEFNREFDWGSVTDTLSIDKNSLAVGKTIVNIGLREKTGATIVAITRGDQTVYDPNPNAYLMPDDEVILVGNEKQIEAAQELLKTQATDIEANSGDEFATQAIYIDSSSFLTGTTLAESRLRSQHRVTVIGIKREDSPVIDPDPTEVIRPGDLLLVVGKKQRVDVFRKFIHGEENN